MKIIYFIGDTELSEKSKRVTDSDLLRLIPEFADRRRLKNGDAIETAEGFIWAEEA